MVTNWVAERVVYDGRGIALVDVRRVPGGSGLSPTLPAGRYCRRGGRTPCRVHRLRHDLAAVLGPAELLGRRHRARRTLRRLHRPPPRRVREAPAGAEANGLLLAEHWG